VTALFAARRHENVAADAAMQSNAAFPDQAFSARLPAGIFP